MSPRTLGASSALLGLLLAATPSAWAPAWAQGQPSSPVATLRAIIHRVDRGTMPCWCDEGFGKAAAPYVTPALISAVAYGGRIARQKSIDLYDAEFFTGRPELHSARIERAGVLQDDGERATVRARIRINADDPKWPQPFPITYVLRRVDGAWKVDDIAWATGEPSVKTHFLHPINPFT